MVESPLFTSVSPCLHPISPMSKHLGMLIILSYSPKDFSATSTYIYSSSKWERSQSFALPLYPTENLENCFFSLLARMGIWTSRRLVTALLVLQLICYGTPEKSLDPSPCYKMTGEVSLFLKALLVLAICNSGNLSKSPQPRCLAKITTHTYRLFFTVLLSLYLGFNNSLIVAVNLRVILF